MQFYRIFLILIGLLLSQSFIAQTHLTGQIIDADSGTGLDKVSITEKSKKVTFFTDENGYFNIELPYAKGTLLLKKEHYFAMKLSYDQAQDFGSIKLTPEPIQLLEVELSSVAKHRKNLSLFVQYLPVKSLSTSTLQGELTKGFKAVPSVYVSAQGGGMGDGKISVRGFDPAQTSIFINEIPINDMETGWVYWSNWSGLSDMVYNINLFSEIYNENLPITSFGGAVNLNTINESKKSFSDFKTAFGSGLLLKNSILHHVADNKNNLSYSFYLNRTSSDGVVKGTSFISNTYYLDITKNLKKHRFKGFILGAPQAHGQRSAYEYHMATLGDYLKYGTNYNYNVGYLNGKELNWTENYFHKNLMQVQWNWQPDTNTSLSADFYSSFGTGGGSYEAGNTAEYITPSDRRLRNPENGAVMWDKIIAYNQGSNVMLADGNYYQRADQNDAYQYINMPFNAGLTKIAFTNKQYWLGGKLIINRDLNQHWKTNLEYHYRYAHADNFDRLADLLGADGFMVFYDQNNIGKIYTQTYPVNILSAWDLLQKPSHFDKLHFHYQSDIALHSLTGKTNYNIDHFSLFAQYNINTQENQRTDFFNYLTNNPNRVSKKITQTGFSGLLGTKFNSENHSLSLIGGLIVKPNRFEQLFLNYKNDINEHLKQENAFSAELNYQYKQKNGFVSLNLYYTDWKNKYTYIAYQNPETLQTGTAFLNDVHQTHWGLESVFYQKWNTNFQTQLALSLGNWEYKGNATGNAYDYSQQHIGNAHLNLNKVKVGNAAQLKSYLSINYTIKQQWEFRLQEQYFGGLYSNLNMNQTLNNTLKLPDYFTTDFYIKSKPFLINKVLFQMELAIENVLNTKYIIESATSVVATTSTDNWKGINAENKVFFGPERNWVLGMHLKF